MDVIAERPRLLDCIEAAFTPHDWEAAGTAPSAPDAEAHRLLERWERTVARHGGPEAFERRLAARGLDRAAALRWLSPRAVRQGAPLPPWALALLALDDPRRWPPAPQGLDAWTAEERAAYDLDEARIPVFPGWLYPFVGLALARLPHAAHDAPTPAAAASVARAVLVRLSHLASRTLAAEIARRGRGDAPAPGEIIDWLARHPALARLLAQSTLASAQAFSEMLAHARADADEIARIFNEGEDPGTVASIVAWRSDAHRGGRSAAFVRFSSGLELVYKPRSHDIDLAFARFAEAAAGAGAPRLHLPRTLARGEHGWSERIRESDCVDAAGVVRYRERQGCIAALAYFLCGMDFHYENFIACGEWPVPIDLEGLMSAARHLVEPEARGLPRHLAAAGMASVLATSMGTYWRIGQDDRALFAASGIAGCGERLWPQKVPEWQGSADAPRLAWRARRYEYRNNLPRLAGERVALDAAGVEDVVRGFRAAYGAVVSQRAALAAADGCVAAFAACPTRVILRDTSEYASLLFWSLAPAHLASGRAYAIAMEMLSGEAPQYELPEAEVLAEDLKCCLEQDVPLWRSEARSRMLLAPSGRRLGPVVPETPLEQAHARLAGAGAEDLQYQSEVLRSSLLAALVSRDEAARLAQPVAALDWNVLSGWALPEAPPPAPEDRDDGPEREALAFARRIGDALADLTLRLPDGAAWLGLTRVAGNATQMAPIVAFPWTAAGAAGTALLFANLFHAFGDARYAELARSALALCDRTCRAIADAGWWHRLPASAYTGAAFPVYAQAECARLLEDEALFDAALERALQLDAARLAADENPDWLAGIAGTAAALVHLGTLRPDARLAERARACIEAIARAEVQQGGFRVPGFERPLLGMAHGAAGIAAACARVHAATGDAHALAIAHRALAFERERFDAGARDWPDLRREGTTRFMSGWCAGPAGAGLARLIAHDVEACDAEIEQAIDNTRERMGIDRHHACCGEAGRMLFLAEAAARLDRPELRREALAAGCKLADFHREAGFLRFQELNDRPWTPGLLDGAAGVALALVAAAIPGASNPLSLGIVGGGGEAA